MSKKLTTEEFIKRAKDIHGDKYDYSKSKYINSRAKIKIICRIHNSEFEQRAYEHYNGQGCPKCANIHKSKTTRENKEDFIKKAREVHGNKYDYSKIEYNGSRKKVIIVCNDGHEFKQEPRTHLSGHGCTICSNSGKTPWNKMSNDEFIQRAKKIHGNKYSYNKTLHTYQNGKVIITCPSHGDFEQMSGNHLAGKGCSECSHFESKGEKELSRWLKSINIRIEKRNRDILSPKEIDIYLPDYKIGIEYNGVYWHSEKRGKTKNYHKEKTELSKEKGIYLMQFWDYEWNDKKEIVKSIIKNKLGICKNKYFARKLTLRQVNTKESRKFCEENHIHSFRGGVKHNGLFNGEELLSLMITANDGEMVRFVTKINTVVVGGFSKLLKYSDVKYSFVDQRIFDGHGYLKNGFKYLYTTQPNYFYTKGVGLESRIKYQKHKLKNKLKEFNEKLTEIQNMNNNGYYRVFDCGHLKMVRNG